MLPAIELTSTLDRLKLDDICEEELAEEELLFPDDWMCTFANTEKSC